MLEAPERIVDTILGLVARSAGQDDTFYNLLSKRQTRQQVGQVMTSLRHLPRSKTQDAVSLRKLPPGKKSKKLGGD